MCHLHKKKPVTVRSMASSDTF